MGWLSGYTYRIKITVTNPADRYKISLTSGELDFAKAEADGEDIRLTLSDGTTLVDYWFETYDSSAQTADIWIEDTSNDTTLYLYYGDSSASYVSNMDDTFTDFHDDFGVWKREGVVLEGTEAWEIAGGARVHEPTVIREGNAQILSGTVFKMWYAAGSPSKIGYAESTDGKTWTKYASNPVLAGDIARPFVMKDGNTYYMTVAPTGDTQIDIYTSSDGLSWTLGAASIVAKEGVGWENDNVAGTYIWKEAANDWRMIYEARGTVWALGYATATSPTGTWTKSGSNPVISETGSRGGPFIIKVGSTYYLWCHGSPTGASPLDIYSYTSTDLTTWIARASGSTVFQRYTADEGINDALGQIGDAHLIEYKGRMFLYYTALPVGGSTPVRIKLAIAPIDLDALILTNEDNLDITDNWTENHTDGDAWVNNSQAILDAPTTKDLAIIKGKTNYGSSKTMEFRVRTLDTSDANYGRIGFSTDITTTAIDQITWWHYHTDDASGAHTETWDNTVRTTNTHVGSQSTTYHNYKIERISNSSIKFYDNDTLKQEHTTNIPTADLPPWIYHYTSTGVGQTEVEWIFIRPYNSTEPTVSFGSEETLAVGIVNFSTKVW